jgi:hypothetical protein
VRGSDGNRDGNPPRHGRSSLNPWERSTSENGPATRPPSQLESESPERVRGFESLRFRSLTSSYPAIGW